MISAYQYNRGDIVTDPSLPVTGVESGINALQLGFQETFSAFGRTANWQVGVPYSWGKTEGTLMTGPVTGPVTRKTAGVADIRARVAINLLGAPAMDPAAFRELRKSPRTIVGASLTVSVPTGEYDETRLLNIGANRWAVKPEMGLIWPLYPTWLVEADVGVWLFGDNDDFLGATRKQDPVFSAEIHLVKELQSGVWVSLDANYYRGGETSVGPVTDENLQRNARFGATMLYPIARGHAIRASYSTGVVTKSGGDFEIFSLSYLYAWR
jgi:hypothetical protein